MMAIVSARKVGHSLVLTIPHEYVEILKIVEGDLFQFVMVKQGFFLEPTRRWTTLDDFFARTPSISLESPGEGKS
jgi:antitoxin component of MazEF toxin-antitoxin module